nr:MAG TPA: hypothetical protein [Caudoviricetes sp.]
MPRSLRPAPRRAFFRFFENFLCPHSPHSPYSPQCQTCTFFRAMCSTL